MCILTAQARTKWAPKFWLFQRCPFWLALCARFLCWVHFLWQAWRFGDILKSETQKLCPSARSCHRMIMGLFLVWGVGGGAPRRFKIFSCTCTHAWCYASNLKGSLAKLGAKINKCTRWDPWREKQKTLNAVYKPPKSRFQEFLTPIELKVVIW